MGDSVKPGLMPWTDNIPKMEYTPDITEIFRNFYVNWTSLSPFLLLLYGVLFGFFVLRLIKKGGE